MRSLLVAALAVSACWSTTDRAPTTTASLVEPAPIDSATPRPTTRTATKESCTEGGERLVLRTCRDGDNLAWTITNATSLPMWAFVAPQGSKRATFSRENVNVRSERGDVVLSKLQLPPVGGERSLVAAILLAPGESDTGSIPLGGRVDPKAENITGARIAGTSEVLTVALEIGFGEQRSADRSQPTQPEPLVVVVNFARARQEIVRAPPVSWR